MEYLNVFSATVFPPNRNFHRGIHVTARNLPNGFWHGGREKQHLPVGTGLFKDGIQLILKTHGKHLIGFIQYNAGDVANPELPPVQKIKHPPRRANHHLRIRLQSPDLLLGTGPAIYGHYPQGPQIP